MQLPCLRNMPPKEIQGNQYVANLLTPDPYLIVAKFNSIKRRLSCCPEREPQINFLSKSSFAIGGSVADSTVELAPMPLKSSD